MVLQHEASGFSCFCLSASVFGIPSPKFESLIPMTQKHASFTALLLFRRDLKSQDAITRRYIGNTFSNETNNMYAYIICVFCYHFKQKIKTI